MNGDTEDDEDRDSDAHTIINSSNLTCWATTARKASGSNTTR